MNKIINHFNYNKLRGRVTFAILFSVVIFLGIIIIDTKSLHNLNLNIRDSVVGKYLDLMSIFVFLNGIIFMLYSYLGAYDVITYLTSTKIYSPIIFSILIVILGLFQIFAGINTLVRLFQLNGLLVSRMDNIYSGIYLFAPSIRGVFYSMAIYLIRIFSDIVMRKKHEEMMLNDVELQKKKERLKKFLRKK